jgi:hypothetical protein
MDMAKDRACVEATVTVYSRPDSPWIQAGQKKTRPVLISTLRRLIHRPPVAELPLTVLSSP